MSTTTVCTNNQAKICDGLQEVTGLSGLCSCANGQVDCSGDLPQMHKLYLQHSQWS